MRRVLVLVSCVTGAACASPQTARTSDALFASAAAEAAREHAPDLYERATTARAAAEEAQRRKDGRAADDYGTEARLWLAAAATEAERIQLDRRRDELQREEEGWAKQLARDQDASALVARDIARCEARAVALREAERLATLDEDPRVSGATLDAVLTRVRLNIALAEALGATDEQLAAARDRADRMEQKGSASAKAAEALTSETEELIGQMRGQWPRPRPGAGTELVQSASAKGFGADRSTSGVVIRSDRFFTTGGQVSSATLERFHVLLTAFPHGPVACKVSVPEPQGGEWARRVALLVERFRRMDDRGRVSTSMIASQSLGTSVVLCTFAAYPDP